ncbi:hypothetical protein [Streptomyces sp. NPDC056707]|uniref:hypothetical protein n=1 Tax=Streptomyces sp. NPDC056707 TaxID=3345919 RepID=UPI00367B7ECB
MSSVDWGDAPTWIAAIFAGGAALFAYMTIRSQRQQIGEQQDFIAEQSETLRLEREELKAQAAERRRAQARAVCMDPQMFYSGPDSVADHWEVSVTNGSNELVRDVAVRFGDAYTAMEARLDSGGGAGGSLPRSVPVHLIGPDRCFVFVSSRLSETALENARPVLLFRDSAGLRWRLDEHGELSEVGEDVTG